MKKYNIHLDDQITDHWIKSDIAPPMCVFPRGGRILDSVYLHPKQLKTMAIVRDVAIYIFCKGESISSWSP